MAANLSTPLGLHFHRIHQNSDKNSPPPPTRFSTKRFTISLSFKSPPNLIQEESKKNPSLSEQLKPLSTTILSDQPNLDDSSSSSQQLLSKPKSIWVNPTKPKPSVLSLQRHQKRSTYSYNPQIRDLRLFAKKLNECESLDLDVLKAILEETPLVFNRDNALLVINSLSPWFKTLVFFNWIKAQELFPLETIFYNVVMKALRFGKQFDKIEELAYEMIDNGIDLDNITYSTIITSAKRCNLFDKAVEWFERMYTTGLMPDEVTYSAVLDVYAKSKKIEEVISLYERGRASGWKPDPIAFAVMGKMFGDAGDYDGIKYVLDEMESLGVKPNLVVYNTLIEAMGKAGKPGLARSLFEEMISLRIKPNEKTLTALIKIYGKARWAKDALELWEKMRLNEWPMDFFLYNTLLSMCADLGLEEEGERLFEDMKGSKRGRPDSWSYTAMMNIYGSGGKVEKAMKMFDEMSTRGVELNVMGYTCLIQCLGRAKRIDDLVTVFDTLLDKGIKPDDRLCGCLLSVLSYCNGNGGDTDKVLGCLQRANSKLVVFIDLLEQEGTKSETLQEEFKNILNNTTIEARRPFCNCLIDICRNRNLQERAHELLYFGTVFGLYPGLHTKTAEEWRLNVRSLSVGAAQTALEEWMTTLTKIVRRREVLPELLSASTGAGNHKFSQGLGSAFALHIEKSSAPFRMSEENAGIFVATRDDIESWVVQSPST